MVQNLFSQMSLNMYQRRTPLNDDDDDDCMSGLWSRKKVRIMGVIIITKCMLLNIHCG